MKNILLVRDTLQSLSSSSSSSLAAPVPPRFVICLHLWDAQSVAPYCSNKPWFVDGVWGDSSPSFSTRSSCAICMAPFPTTFVVLALLANLEFWRCGVIEAGSFGKTPAFCWNKFIKQSYLGTHLFPLPYYHHNQQIHARAHLYVHTQHIKQKGSYMLVYTSCKIHI